MKILKMTILLAGMVVSSVSCQHTSNHSTSDMQHPDQSPNRLLHETSPYLLQHAYNPVDWFPWGEEALGKATSENKPIIVSIGYSSCHWCHVMEHESFENNEVAEIMNHHFVNIKVDREERLDVDQIYMDAVQAMGVNGGWPLNVFLTPEGKPFYGGTYFPKDNWINLLLQVNKAYSEHEDELRQQANELTKALGQSEMKRYGLTQPVSEFNVSEMTEMMKGFPEKFDEIKGGLNKAPKFPMPSIYEFLLRYHFHTNDEKALNHTLFTLRKMARGGIYDQIGGGFARYSVDADWFAPHFEKMLYDNAQLLSLYAHAFAIGKDPEFLTVIEETVAFLEREMMDSSGGFYSALDADSEGEEGKFYVWQADELPTLLGDDYALFSNYYQVNEAGNWEHGNNILHRNLSDADFAQKQGIGLKEFQTKVSQWKGTLLPAREKRIRPGLDDKVLTSWNGLLLTGLCDAFAHTQNEKFLNLAEKNARFLAEQMMQPTGKLWHSYKEGKVSIDAYLEDYATVIQGFIKFYQVSFDPVWLEKASTLLEYAKTNFFDAEEGMFFFTDGSAEKLIARKKELFDNVIPASNSMMAHNLYQLGVIMDREEDKQLAKDMLGKTVKLLKMELQYLTHWGNLYADMIEESREIVIVGENFKEFGRELQKEFLPGKVVLATAQETDDLPLFKNRTTTEGNTTVYVCQNKACQLPVQSTTKAWELMKKGK